MDSLAKVLSAFCSMAVRKWWELVFLEGVGLVCEKPGSTALHKMEQDNTKDKTECGVIFMYFIESPLQ